MNFTKLTLIFLIATPAILASPPIERKPELEQTQESQALTISPVESLSDGELLHTWLHAVKKNDELAMATIAEYVHQSRSQLEGIFIASLSKQVEQ